MRNLAFGRAAHLCLGALICVVVASCSPAQPEGELPAVSLPAPLPTSIFTVDSLNLPTPTPPDPSATAMLPTATPAAPTEYVVQAGDTMLGLAADWGVSMASIQILNGLGESTSLQAGARLVVPAGEEWDDASQYWVVYVVRSGETLGEIAKRYGFDVPRLMEVNGLADANLVRADQEIVLPLNTLAAYAEAPEPQSAAAEAAPTPALPVTPTAEAVAAEVMTESSAIVPPAPLSADIAEWPRETVRLINEIRAQHGLPPYLYNETLAQAAQAHANDCVARGWCSHTGSDGSSVKARILRAGYGGTGWAECWAQQPTPQGAVDIWMDEVPPDDPHRRMMLHTWFTEVGVGVAEAPWGYYFIADFGRP